MNSIPTTKEGRICDKKNGAEFPFQKWICNKNNGFYSVLMFKLQFELD